MNATGRDGADDASREAGDLGPVRVQYDRSVPGVFVARIAGRGGDADAAARRWRHLVESARAGGKASLMVARDLAGPVLTEGELAGMLARLSDLDLDGMRIALVQPHLERQHIDELGAQLAMDRGGMIRVFEDEASALIWLRHGHQDEASHGEP